jgi:hypothetical protein
MYTRFFDEAGQKYGSFEVFYRDPDTAKDGDCWRDGDGELLPAGWYWWACFPGCTPDSDPHGPFDTQDEAEADAQNSE